MLSEILCGNYVYFTTALYARAVLKGQFRCMHFSLHA